MGKSSNSSDRQPADKSPLHQLARDPSALRRAHAAVHHFVEQFEDEVEDAVHAARARQLASIRDIEQTVRYLQSRDLLADQAAGTCPRKPRGLAIEPDFILGVEMLEAVPFGDCLERLHNAIVALQPHEGKPFGRKPLLLRPRGTSKSAAAVTKPGPEETALADLERATDDIINLFRGLVKQLAASSTTRAARRKTPKGEPSGMFTPPQVAKQLGVSPDKILAWIRKGELHATNVAAVGSGRPRYRISAEDLAKFQAMRQNVKPPPKPPRRGKKDDGVIQFFK